MGISSSAHASRGRRRSPPKREGRIFAILAAVDQPPTSAGATRTCANEIPIEIIFCWLEILIVSKLIYSSPALDPKVSPGEAELYALLSLNLNSLHLGCRVVFSLPYLLCASPTYLSISQTSDFPEQPQLLITLTMDIRPGVWRPLSVPEIIKRAEEFEYNPLISLKYWLRTADALQKEVRASSASRFYRVDRFQRLASTSVKAMNNKPTSFFSGEQSSSLRAWLPILNVTELNSVTHLKPPRSRLTHLWPNLRA